MSEPIQSIAQNNYILATQQEISHDNSLSGNGTVDSPLGVVPGYNETVLWSDTTNGLTSGSLVLNEPWSGFEKIRLDVVDQFGWGGSCMTFDTTNLAGKRLKHFACTYSFIVTGSPNTTYNRGIQLEFANGQYISGSSVGLETKVIPTSTIASTTTSGGAKLIKVVGINRKAQ